MPKLKGGKTKKKRNLLQVTVPKASSRTPNKDTKSEANKRKDRGSGATDQATDHGPSETRSKRTPKPRKIVDISSPPPKLRQSKSAMANSNKSSQGKGKRASTPKKKTSSKATTKTTKGGSRVPAAKGKRKRASPKKSSRPAKQMKIEQDVSDSGEDIARDLQKSPMDIKVRASTRGSSNKRAKVEEEVLQEELAPLPAESDDEEEEVDEEEDEVDDSLFFGLPPEKPLDDQDGLKEPETYACSHCREKFKKEDLPEHLSQCPDRYVQCRECGKVLSNLQTLERHHKRFHLKIREVPCTLCEKMFIDEAAARKHLKTVHFKVKNFHCPHCDKAFSQRNKLTYHVRTHSGEKPYSCTECGRSFSLLWNLKTHMRTHTGEKPYACDICGRQFTQKQNMTSHMTTHRKPKPDRRTFPGLAGAELNVSSSGYGYETTSRSSSSTVKSQTSVTKPYSLPNVLKTNYLAGSKPVVQGLGQQYLLEDVASVVDVPGRQEVQTKITTQSSLGAATAQINQSLINQQVLAQQNQCSVSAETGLGLLSAVARKGDDSNVQVDGIVSLEGGQHNTTGNPGLDQVVEVFLQSSANEATGDNFIPSMVGAETMVSTSEMEQDASGVVDANDASALLPSDHVSAEKEPTSPNKQVVGQITAQTVIPVDQANLAGLANILQNPEILAAINAASSSNKFIVIGPVGMFSGQQSAAAGAASVNEAGTTLQPNYNEELTETSADMSGQPEISEVDKVAISGAGNGGHSRDEIGPSDENSILDAHEQTVVGEENEGGTTHPEDKVDHKYVQGDMSDATSLVQGTEEVTSSSSMIQIPTSFSRVVAGMSSRITTNNISDVTAALIHEIQGQIQDHGNKTVLTSEPAVPATAAYDVAEASGVSPELHSVVVTQTDIVKDVIGGAPLTSNSIGVDTGNKETTPEDHLDSIHQEVSSISQNSESTETIHFQMSEISGLAHVSNGVKQLDASGDSDSAFAPNPSPGVSCVTATITSDSTANTGTGSSEQNESYITVATNQALGDNIVAEAISSTTAVNANTVYLSQLPNIVTGQVTQDGVVTGHFNDPTQATEATVVVNPSIVQSLLNNMNIQAKSAGDNGDFPVIDIATGSYLGTSSMLNSVPVTGEGLEVTIEPQQVATSSAPESNPGQIVLTTSGGIQELQVGATSATASVDSQSVFQEGLYSQGETVGAVTTVTQQTD